MLLINLNQNKSRINNYISASLLEKIEENIVLGKKIILYLNKRGEYTSFICEDCNYFYKCKNCDVALKVHSKKLLCHICSYSKDLDFFCEKCKSKNLKKIGVGTQQIESSLKNYFKNKNINIFRFDLDSVKNKYKKKEALENLFKSQIIIATKMITTGFDFRNLGLIGIILLEQEFSYPYYNTEEKAYSNIKQLIGRGNRMGEKTEILCQTFIPDNEIVKNILERNYKNFFLHTLEERKIFNYPPFIEMFSLEYKNRVKQKSIDFMINLYNKLNLLNKNKKIEIILNIEAFKKNNNYYTIIILKGNNLRKFLENIKTEIFRNKDLVVIFK